MKLEFVRPILLLVVALDRFMLVLWFRLAPAFWVLTDFMLSREGARGIPPTWLFLSFPGAKLWFLLGASCMEVFIFLDGGLGGGTFRMDFFLGCSVRITGVSTLAGVSSTYSSNSSP